MLRVVLWLAVPVPVSCSDVLSLFPQSSLHSKGGLGVTTLSALYGAVLLSSMFLPPILIKRFGCKWTITGAMGCYVAFSLGNFKDSWYGPPLPASQFAPSCHASI